MKLIISTLALLLSFNTFAQTSIKCEGGFENSEAVTLYQMLPEIARYDFDPKLTITVEEYLLPRISDANNLRISVLKLENSESIDLQGTFSDGSDFEVSFTDFSLKKKFPAIKKAIQKIVPIKIEAEYPRGQKITLEEFRKIMNTKEVRSVHTFYGLIAGSATIGDGAVKYSCGIFFNGQTKK